MSAALCIDFGTSSIRISLRDETGRVQVLPIGEATGSRSIDEASIRSEIHIDQEGKNVRFGEKAFDAKSKLARSPFFEASPKLWLKEPAALDSPAFEGLEVTRKELLTGLIAYSMHGAIAAMKSKKLQKDIRIAHPIWDRTIANLANKALSEIGFLSSQVVSIFEKGLVSVALLRATIVSAKTGTLAAQADVVEPVAAALQLLDRQSNTRRVCAVVDVGAGTTDVGFFQSVVSEERPKPISDRLIPISPAQSVFRAGNDIDLALTKALIEKSGVSDELGLYDLRVRIRQVKEFLFKQGFIQELGVRFSLQEFSARKEVKSIVTEIRRCLESVAQASKTEILTVVRAGGHSQANIDVVMAGGGGQIPFIREAVSKPIQIGSIFIPVRIVSTVEGQQLNRYGASVERLAVALGGVHPAYDALRHQHDKLTRIPGLGDPKQNAKDLMRPSDKQVVVSPQTEAPAGNSIKVIHLENTQEEERRKADWRAAIDALAIKADQGDKDAQYEIAIKLRDKSKQYVKEAMDWLLRAARQGHEQASVDLAHLLTSGIAVEQDVANAYFWMASMVHRGFAQHANEAKRLRSKLLKSVAEKMDDEVRSWRPTSENKSAMLCKVAPPKKQNLVPKVMGAHSVAANDLLLETDKKRISALMLAAKNLRASSRDIRSTEDLMRWAKTKTRDVFEATFLAAITNTNLKLPEELTPDKQKKLDSWLRWSKGSSQAKRR